MGICLINDKIQNILGIKKILFIKEVEETITIDTSGDIKQEPLEYNSFFDTTVNEQTNALHDNLSNKQEVKNINKETIMIVALYEIWKK